MNNIEKPVTDYQLFDERFFVNIARGLAVFLMLWGHCIQYCSAGSFDFFENSIFRIIYSFHMPLFMLISGYLFFFSAQKRPFKELLVHRTQSLLHAIVTGAVFCFIFWDVLTGFYNHNYTVMIGGNWLGRLTFYWFLWSTLSASVPVAVAYKTTEKKWIRAFILIGGFLFVSLMPCADMNIYMYPYFVLGFLYAEYKNSPLMKKAHNVMYLSIILFPVMMLFFKKEHYIYTSGLKGTEGLIKHMPVNLYRWAIGLVGSVFALTVLFIIYSLINKWFKKIKPFRLLEKLGSNSLEIYILSCVFLSIYLPIVYKRFVAMVGENLFAQNNILYYGMTLVLSLLYSIGLLLIVKLLKRLKIHRFMFGR